jgi:hypothetical protein
VNEWDTFWVGIAPQHAPALLAVALLPIGLWALRRLGAPSWPAVPITERWAAVLLGIAAVVHLALPLGHVGSPLLTIGFLGSGGAYAWLALRAREGRRWRGPAAMLIVATLVAYLIGNGAGGEEPDQVGIATALVELTALGLALVPPREPDRPRRLRRLAGAGGTLAAALVVGVALWIGAFVAHRHADAAAAADRAVTEAPTGGHSHGHDVAARAQAGVIMCPAADRHPTAAHAAVADQLAAETRASLRRYADLRAALSAGYRPQGVATGLDVHLEHPGYKKDGRILDPSRPEMLVYAVDGGRATLLGAVFVMEHAGVPGPQPGGPITGWHAHNLCITLLPPGFGVVSPYGGCPAFSFSVTIPEMMHLWTVDNPEGPYAEGLGEAWVRAYHAEHGRPVAIR